MRRMSSSATGVSVRRAARYGILWPFDFMKSTVIVTVSLLAIRPGPKPSWSTPRPGASEAIASNASIARGSGVSPSASPLCSTAASSAGTSLPGPCRSAAERLGPVLALGGDRDADHFSQRLEGLAGMAGALESGECRIRDPLRFLERTLARHRGERRRHVDQPFPVVVLRQLFGGFLEIVVLTLLGETRGEIAEQRAPVVAAARVAQALGELLGQLEVVRHDGPGAGQRLQPGGILAHALMGLDQEPRGGLRLHERERTLRDGRKRLPLLGGEHLVAEREQRLLCALDLAVERAHGREQVVHAPGRGRLRLLQPAAQLVAHPRQPLLLLGGVGQRLEFRARGSRQVGSDFATEHSGEGFANGHGLAG